MKGWASLDCGLRAHSVCSRCLIFSVCDAIVDSVCDAMCFWIVV